MESKLFETDRLFLKPTSEEDAAFILTLMNTEGWLQYIGDRKVKTIADAKAYIKTKMEPQYERLGYGNYTVIRKEDGAKLGTCGLYDREGLSGVDIGFAFLPEYARKGYAVEAASKIKEAAITKFNLKKISGITTKDNLPSQRLLEKLGLTYIKPINIPNDDEELLLYEFEQ